MAEEMKEPQKNLPRAIAGGVGLACLIYGPGNNIMIFVDILCP